MKINSAKQTLIASALTLGIQCGYSQGFVNLDFESAKIIPLTAGADFPPYSIATTNALPGWTVFYGTSQQSQITYNDPALGSTFVTLYATNGLQIGGNYSVLLQGGLTASAASISQTGLVPVGTESLLFDASGNAPNSTTPILQVSLGGQNIPFVAMSVGPGYTLYGADVSAFAGQTNALTFAALEASNGYNDWNIDNIQFSSSPIPEPSMLCISALGSIFLFTILSRRHSMRTA